MSASDLTPARRYMKPVLFSLHYSTEREVTIAANCQQISSATGPTFSGCQQDVTNPAPCVNCCS